MRSTEQSDCWSVNGLMIVCARQGKEFRSLYLPSRAIEIFWMLDIYSIARHKGNKAFIFFRTLWYAEQLLGGFFVVVLFVFLFSVFIFFLFFFFVLFWFFFLVGFWDFVLVCFTPKRKGSVLQFFICMFVCLLWNLWSWWFPLTSFQVFRTC